MDLDTIAFGFHGFEVVFDAEIEDDIGVDVGRADLIRRRPDEDAITGPASWQRLGVVKDSVKSEAKIIQNFQIRVAIWLWKLTHEMGLTSHVTHSK